MRVLECDMHRLVRTHQGHTIKTIVYSEVDVLKWRGQPPKVELVYDETMRFLLKVSFHLNRAETRLTPQVRLLPAIPTCSLAYCRVPAVALLFLWPKKQHLRADTHAQHATASTLLS